MTNSEIATIFHQIADLLEFQSANPFRIRAYRNAARAISDLTEPVSQILDDETRKLTDLSGIGKDLAAKTAELVETGSLPMLDELLAEIPESVLALLRIPGLGPKRAATLHRELGVNSLDELRDACQQHRVCELKGFGKKTEQTILDGLAIASEAEKRMLWPSAEKIAQAIQAHLRPCPGFKRMQIAGSFRRGKETVGDLDVLVVADDSTQIMDWFGKLPGTATVLVRGDTKMSIRLNRGVQVDLRVVPDESFGAALQYFTGSKDHNVTVREIAKSRGLKLNEYGLFRGDEQIAGMTEEEIYAALDLPWFPPELREARHEFHLAAEGELPTLIELDDLRGDLHMHSNWTDGTESIERMAEASKQRGMNYIAITDHSQRVHIAGGLGGEDFLRQWAEIDDLNSKLEGIQVLKGVEVDILEPGGLDLDDQVLAQADWVIASVHFGQNQSCEQITHRVVEALKNPHVSAFAHPTGRLLNRRKAYEIDLNSVLETAREYGKLIELNSHPMRLDLDDVACASAKRLGVPIVISTDAHNIAGLDTLRFGIQQARRAGLTNQDVANTLDWDPLKQMLHKGRGR